jgi:hypothetical protein
MEKRRKSEPSLGGEPMMMVGESWNRILEQRDSR